MPDARLATDFNEMRRFANELERFCDALEFDTRKLRDETDFVTSSAWKGEQAEEFARVITDNGNDLVKDIRELRELIDKIRASANLLEAARNRKIS